MLNLYHFFLLLLPLYLFSVLIFFSFFPLFLVLRYRFSVILCSFISYLCVPYIPHTIPIAVPEYGLSLHENIQSHLHDATNWPLEWLSTIFSAHAARIPIEFVGGYQ